MNTQEHAAYHVYKTGGSVNANTKALVEVLIAQGNLRELEYRSVSHTQADLSTWDDVSYSYIAQRAQEYGQEPEWLVALLPDRLLQSPKAACDALDKAGALAGMQIEHITSQANAPELAHEASNLILAPSDGFNQSLGSNNMAAHQVQRRLEDSQDYFEAAVDYYDLPEVAAGTASFQDVWNLFGELTRQPLRVLYSFHQIDKPLWTRMIKLGQRIINDMPRIHDRKTRERMLDDIRDFIEEVDPKTIHAVFIMTLLISHVPWAAGLLAAKGLATLAKMVLNAIDSISDWVEKNLHLKGVSAFVRTLTKPLRTIVNFFEYYLDKAWELVTSCVKAVAATTSAIVEAAAKAVGDVIVSCCKAAGNVIKSIWSGFTSIFNFRPRFA